MDESGYFMEAAGPELKNKNVLEEGNEAGEYLVFDHLLLHHLQSCRYILRVCINWPYFGISC